MANFLWKRGTPLLKLFAVSFVGAFACFFGIVQAFDFFKITILTSNSAKYIKLLIIVLASTIIGCISIIISDYFGNKPDTPNSVDISFDSAIIKGLQQAMVNKNYYEVIKIGDASLRPLFESGSFSTRLRVGHIVENAAALRVEKRRRWLHLLTQSAGHWLS